MVKTDEAAHGRRVEKRRVEGAGVGPAQDVHSAVPWSGERGGGVVLVPPCGGRGTRGAANMTVFKCVASQTVRASCVCIKCADVDALR